MLYVGAVDLQLPVKIETGSIAMKKLEFGELGFFVPKHAH
jgi:hypothetical protein